MRRLKAPRDLCLLICIPLPGLVSRSNACTLGVGERECCEDFADRQTQWVGREDKKVILAPKLAEGLTKVSGEDSAKRLEGRIFLIFVTNSDGMLWWHTS